MRRRQYIQAIGSIGIAGVAAGCSSDGSSEPEQESGNSGSPDETAEIDTPTETPQQNIEIISSYTVAHEGLKAGKDLLSTAINAFNQENYSVAAGSMSDYESRMSDVSNNFYEASEAASELGKQEIVEAAKAGEAAAQHFGNAGSYVNKAASAAQNSERDAANSYIEDTRSAVEKANADLQDVEPPGVIESLV